MSLHVKISASEGKNSIIAYECTGEYSGANKGGYSGPNPRVEDVEEAYLLITTPSLPKGSEPYKIDVYPDFPSQETLGYEILPNQIGQSNGQIESGKYIIKYVVSGVDKKGVKFKKADLRVYVFTKSITCCLDKWTRKLDKNVSRDEKQKKIVELSNLLVSVEYQIGCGLYDIANESVEYLKEQCKCSGC